MAEQLVIAIGFAVVLGVTLGVAWWLYDELVAEIKRRAAINTNPDPAAKLDRCPWTRHDGAPCIREPHKSGPHRIAEQPSRQGTDQFDGSGGDE